MAKRHTAEIVIFGGLILLCGLWQFSPRGWVSLWGGRPLLFVPLTVSAAMCLGPVGGAVIGIAAGLFWGVYADALFGFHALLLMVLGCAAGLLTRLLLRNNAYVASLLCGGAAVLYTFADWLYNCLVRSTAQAVALLPRAMLPDLLCTLLVSLPLYIAVRALAKRLKRRT